MFKKKKYTKLLQEEFLTHSFLFYQIPLVI